MKKQSLIDNLVALAALLALILICFILSRVLPSAGPLSNPSTSQSEDFQFRLEQSGDPPLTEFRALVSYGENSPASLQVDRESPQVVIGSNILIYGEWKPEWEEVRIDFTGPDGADLGTYY